VFLKNGWIEREINKINKNGVSIHKEEGEDKWRALVDLSSPNIAKNMHVGHLRSTIQGDCIARVLEFLGHDVMRINHVGDWGTQFGMLIAELFDKHPEFLEDKLPEIADLETFYQNAKKRFDSEEEFRKRAQENVVLLQSGDPMVVKGWKMLCEVSRQEFQKIYDRLDVRLEEMGESFYNSMLKPLVEDMLARGIAKEDDGAICIFVPGKKLPAMIRKRDGGYNYDTTDMAAVNYRVNTLNRNKIIVTTDAGQAQHFEIVWAAAKLAGYYDPSKVDIRHMPFGLVLQPVSEEEKKAEEKAEAEPKADIKAETKEEEKGDEKPGEGKKKKKAEGGKKPKAKKISTREGKSVKLMQLLDEAKDRALQQFK